MLRIITQTGEAQTELKRIRDRIRDQDLLVQQEVVRDIIETVKRQGNQALLDYTEKFDKLRLTEPKIKVSGSDLDAAYQQISKELLLSIEGACQTIEAFHRQRVPKSWVHFGDDEVVRGRKYTPVERAGLYVPGGPWAHLSLVLLQAIPAKVAQVSQIVMVTPPTPSGSIHPGILVAAQEAGVTEIYRVGGAQAIAALAYGTETIPKVDVITGLGDIYVTLAKKMVYGTVGIDVLAEASELLIIVDESVSPAVIAADLIAQAERNPLAAAILITLDADLAEKVNQEIQQQIQGHRERIFPEKALAHYGLIVVVDSLEEAANLSNFFAPQHLQLAVADPWEILEKIHHAGAIFLGTSTPVVVGDYLGGSTTAGDVRYGSALGVETFIKHSNVIQYSPVALKKMSSTIQSLAQAEGLFSAVDSVKLRTEIKKRNND